MSDGNGLKAIITAPEMPSEKQKEKILSFLNKKYGDVELVFSEDSSVCGGFRLTVGLDVYDWTNEGRLSQYERYIEKVNEQGGIIPILQSEDSDWVPDAECMSIGEVVFVGDGIVRTTGPEDAEFGEILLFESGIKGMVQDINENGLGCVLFGDGTLIRIGSKVRRSGKTAGIPVSPQIIGRVIDSLGNPIDGGNPIPATEYMPVEASAPGIIDRQPVNAPLETGILAVDSMFPIGRGQRELIIGDRQTGKTTIAVDTILNQKGKGVICIYVAIGQKASSVSYIVNTLKVGGAMDYTIVMCAGASDPVPFQYIAPYSGCAIGEYFMKQGKDVLIVYDDLSKHAVAYRTISLLLERTPGREAYPGDVFYLHSRLLERSAHLSAKLGGGSLTAIPIIETQQGDVSAYIPTNIISITDGQLFLETEMFFRGQRPALNVGLSVSRVGSSAQTPVIRKTGKNMRIELAQYREMKIFTQFSDDLDEQTAASLELGRSLTAMLCQQKHSPLRRHQQAALLLIGMNKGFMNVPEKTYKMLIDKFFVTLKEKMPEFCKNADENGSYSEEDFSAILKLWQKEKEEWMASEN